MCTTSPAGSKLLKRHIHVTNKVLKQNCLQGNILRLVLAAPLPALLQHNFQLLTAYLGQHLLERAQPHVRLVMHVMQLLQQP